MCDPNNFTCPHENFVTSGLRTRNRIQQNVGVGEAHPKSYDPGGQPTGFEDPCRTLRPSMHLLWTRSSMFSEMAVLAALHAKRARCIAQYTICAILHMQDAQMH